VGKLDNQSQETGHDAFALFLDLDARFGGISLDGVPAGWRTAEGRPRTESRDE
jgi:hypothetical protein